MTTDFTTTIETDAGEIEVAVTATGTVDPRDPSVGIMFDGIEDISFTATDENGKILDLSAADRERIENLAYENLTAKLSEADA